MIYHIGKKLNLWKTREKQEMRCQTSIINNKELNSKDYLDIVNEVVEVKSLDLTVKSNFLLLYLFWVLSGILNLIRSASW